LWKYNYTNFKLLYTITVKIYSHSNTQLALFNQHITQLININTLVHFHYALGKKFSVGKLLGITDVIPDNQWRQINHALTVTYRPETWDLAGQERHGYEQWRVIFARSILAWCLHIGCTQQNRMAWAHTNGYVDDKVQVMNSDIHLHTPF